MTIHTRHKKTYQVAEAKIVEFSIQHCLGMLALQWRANYGRIRIEVKLLFITQRKGRIRMATLT